MNTEVLLVRTPQPFPTESFVGYVLRVSERNGYDSPRQLLHLAQISLAAYPAPGLAVEPLARILGFDPEQLEPIAYRAHAGTAHHFKILEHPLRGGLSHAPLRLKTPAFCPQCVSQRGYLDAFWDLTVAVGCYEHRRHVLTHCPTCHERVSAMRPGLLTCRCGASLRNAQTDALDTPTVELMGVLQAKLHQRPLSSVANTSGLPMGLLEQLTLWTVIRLLKTLERCEAQEPVGSKAAVPPPAQGEGGSLAAAVAALARWPQGYREFLARSESRHEYRWVSASEPWNGTIVTPDARLRVALAPLHKAYVAHELMQRGFGTAEAREELPTTAPRSARRGPQAPRGPRPAPTREAIQRLLAQRRATLERIAAGVHPKRSRVRGTGRRLIP